MPAEPETPTGIGAEPPAPAEPETPTGIGAEPPAPAEPETPTGIGAEPPAPAEPETPTGIGAEPPAPAEPETPTGIGAEPPAPAEPETPTGIGAEPPAPAEPETPTGIGAEPPAPAEPETPTGIGAEPPAPAEPETPTGIGAEPPAPAEPETPPGIGAEPPALVEPETPPGIGAESPAPAEPETPVGIGAEPPALVEPETPPGIGAESPAPAEPETPVGIGAEPPALVEPETPPGIGAESPAPAEPETPVGIGAEPPALVEPETPPGIGAESPALAEPETPVGIGAEPPAPAEPETPPVVGAEPPAPAEPETPPVVGAEPPAPDEPETPPGVGAEPPRAYNPSIRTPKKTQTKACQKRKEYAGQRSKPINLQVFVRVVFGRRNSVQVSLLPARGGDLGEEIEVMGPNGEESWFACQDEWYDDFIPADISDCLANGIRWNSGRATWVLSPRDIFVLAASQTISGFVSTTRLLLHEDHLILCQEGAQEIVREELEKAGCGEVDCKSGHGIPEGWALFSNVRPTVAVDHDESAGIRNVLRPVEDIDIYLEGGIRLSHKRWLHGHPPRIRIRGGSDEIPAVSIDARAASRNSDGSFETQTAFSLGQREVFCGGVTEQYEIAEGQESWDPFEAFMYNMDRDQNTEVSVCESEQNIWGNSPSFRTRYLME